MKNNKPLWKKILASVILVWGAIGLTYFLLWNGRSSVIPFKWTSLSILIGLIVILINIWRVWR